MNNKSVFPWFISLRFKFFTSKFKNSRENAFNNDLSNECWLPYLNTPSSVILLNKLWKFWKDLLLAKQWGELNGMLLRKLKKENKWLSSKGKLSDRMLDKSRNCYGIAIRSNADNIESIRKSILTTLFHCSSSEDTISAKSPWNTIQWKHLTQ